MPGAGPGAGGRIASAQPEGEPPKPVAGPNPPAGKMFTRVAVTVLPLREPITATFAPFTTALDEALDVPL